MVLHGHAKTVLPVILCRSTPSWYIISFSCCKSLLISNIVFNYGLFWWNRSNLTIWRLIDISKGWFDKIMRYNGLLNERWWIFKFIFTIRTCWTRLSMTLFTFSKKNYRSTCSFQVSSPLFSLKFQPGKKIDPRKFL